MLYKNRRVVGKKIETVEDYRASDYIYYKEMSSGRFLYSMDKNDRPDDVLKGQIDYINNEGRYNIYQGFNKARTPVISEEIDEAINMIAEDFVEDYRAEEDNWEYDCDTSVDRLLKVLKEKFEIKLK